MDNFLFEQNRISSDEATIFLFEKKHTFSILGEWEWEDGGGGV